ncbi:DHA1 family tetracycline resistance protein-like MFS transporter [Roseateles asaccharophilus]|uniref:DHA1 family tetracycline resistance protein-like MFS transporter n=2 Tax=Roseateles asaccharophilus TaxID=582607 RepID=A0ABU2A3M6_9BURK|nr:DHA1 family tetracycline resistance protein-like MFS transporter [Roseateles asaccharophilus]
MSRSPQRTPAMGFIMAAVLIDMISIGLMVPVLPHIVGTFTHSNDEQTSAFLLVTMAFGIANFFGSPILGGLSDRFGRRPVLLIGFAGLALSFFVTALATALWMLVAVRLFSGAMQANIAVANAYVADITAPEDRARRFGQLGAMFGIGFILGPLIGGWLGQRDVHWPFIAAGCMAIVNWCYGWFVLPESLPLERRTPFNWKKANPVGALRGLAALKGVGSLVGVIALSSLAQFMLHMTWVLYTKFKFGWGPKEVSWSLALVGIVSVISQGVLLKPLLARFGPQRLALIGMGSASLAYLGFGLASAGWMMYAVIGFNLLGGVAAAAVQGIISSAAPANQQGQAMGAVSSLNSLMAVLGPVIGLTLLGWVSHRPAGDLLMGLPFFTCAALQFIGLIAAYRFFHRQRPALQTA